jgi:hypothetical protein
MSTESTRAGRPLPPWRVVARLNREAIRHGHGPIEHYRLCRRLFGMRRCAALRATYQAYRVNIKEA